MNLCQPVVVRQIIKVKAKAQTVCPDGKEKEVGGCPKGTISVICKKGRVRMTRCFIHSAMPPLSSMESNASMPCCRLD